jgi:hypothetical protein
MGQKPIRERDRRLPLGAGPLPYGKPVENPAIQIDKRFAFRPERRSGRNGTGTSTGVQANQNEPSDVP